MKSVLLLTLALMVAVNSYSNYQTLAHAQLRAPSEHRTMARTAFVATAFEAEPVVARGDSKAELRGLMHGLRVNFSLAIFLVFTIATSMKERMK